VSIVKLTNIVDYLTMREGNEQLIQQMERYREEYGISM
jgi:hypothetical protein